MNFTAEWSVVFGFVATVLALLGFFIKLANDRKENKQKLEDSEQSVVVKQSVINKDIKNIIDDLIEEVEKIKSITTSNMNDIKQLTTFSDIEINHLQEEIKNIKDETNSKLTKIESRLEKMLDVVIKLNNNV